MSAPSPAPAARLSAAIVLPVSARRAVAARRLDTVRGAGTAAVTLVVALSLLLPIGAVLQIVMTSQFDDRTPTQAIVVLDSGRVWADSADVLDSRLTHAAELYREGVAPVIVVTGPPRQALHATADLVSLGVPEADIVSFSSGSDTLGSLQVVAGVMRDLDWSAATIVTDPAHSARAQATAGVLGIDAHLSPSTQGPGSTLTAEYIGGETIALLKFHLLNRWSLPQLVD